MDTIEEREAIIYAVEKSTTAAIQKTELAKKLGITRMSLFNKLKTGKFSTQEKNILKENGIEWLTPSSKNENK